MSGYEQFKIRARLVAAWLWDRFMRFLSFSLYVLTAPWRFFRVVCFFVGLATMLATAGVSVYAVNFMNSLPDFQNTSFADLRSVARERIYKRLEDKRKRYKWVSLRDISRDYLYAIVMSEDSTFFEHDGLDYEALVDSLATNLRKREIATGGSTISQQTVKNLFLTPERQIKRKIKEILITQDMETYLSKNQILELYLNIAEFGPDIYGVNAASNIYFGKNPSDINAAEGAFLALMLPSPRRFHYSIYQNKNLSKTKRRKIRRILGDMLHNEFISAKQYYGYLKFDYFYNHPDRQIASQKQSKKKRSPRGKKRRGRR